MFYQIIVDGYENESIETTEKAVAVLLAEIISLTNENVLLLQYNDNNIFNPEMGWLYNNGKTNTIGKCDLIEPID